MSSPHDPNVRLNAALKSGAHADAIAHNVQLRRVLRERREASSDYVQRNRTREALHILGLTTQTEESVRDGARERGPNRCDGLHASDAMCQDCIAERKKERERAAKAGAA